MKIPRFNEMLENLVEKKVREMIKADEDFAKRIRRFIDYACGDVQEGAFEEINNGQ